MGLSFTFNATHEAVPEDVKDKVEPIDYMPAPEDERPQGDRVCANCGEPYFYYFTTSTNCNWCGRQFCTRCCPNRHLLGGKPGCPECTRKAYLMKRKELLNDHLAAFHMSTDKVAEVNVALQE
ncbi:hypothetical protein TraAM80_07481 [Trypanosoma rangeli]|uniref:FYVE-type domain-containing protein n=1 Tax=Trypanosoma rangeli TaxID=5698 RepID=A0A422N525_TRYRA|nr:uncharacterized protein TraAM80_07481 [Trypanosoma rangeli]RNF00577.1 hypothetical protein TraAM80_07481 [Trypanosoma rangeli]|eukprot:RNF00577.1 hypothetical protein TraAM80_07481 [Trypanosoma rangeli]